MYIFKVNKYFQLTNEVIGRNKSERYRIEIFLNLFRYRALMRISNKPLKHLRNKFQALVRVLLPEKRWARRVASLYSEVVFLLY